MLNLSVENIVNYTKLNFCGITLLTWWIVMNVGSEVTADSDLPDEVQVIFKGSARPKDEPFPDGTIKPHDLEKAIEGVGSDDFNRKFPNGIKLFVAENDSVITFPSLRRVHEYLDALKVERAHQKFLLVLNAAFNGNLLSESRVDNLLKMVFDPDPVITYDMSFTNPHDSPVTMFFSIDGNIGPLSFQGPAKASLDVSVTDTGGAAGANLDVIQTFSVSAEDSAGNVVNRFVDFTILQGNATNSTPASDLAFDDRNSFAAAGETPVGMRIGTDLTLSAGDTARLSGYFAIGDENSPIPSNEELAVLLEFVESWIPEFEVSLLGDFDSDGSLDVDDIDQLTATLGGNDLDTFDLDGDGVISQSDRTVWITELANSFFGDANLDGEFNSTDMITVFQAAEYEDGVAGNSLWSEGDWNGDLDFDSGDLILAFQDGGFEQGPRVTEAVPEPTSFLALCGWLAFLAATYRLR